MNDTEDRKPKPETMKELAALMSRIAKEIGPSEPEQVFKAMMSSDRMTEKLSACVGETLLQSIKMSPVADPIGAMKLFETEGFIDKKPMEDFSEDRVLFTLNGCALLMAMYIVTLDIVVAQKQVISPEQFNKRYYQFMGELLKWKLVVEKMYLNGDNEGLTKAAKAARAEIRAQRANNT